MDSEPHLFDFVVVNDDFERAYNNFLKAIEEELSEYMSHNKVKAAVTH